MVGGDSLDKDVRVEIFPFRQTARVDGNYGLAVLVCADKLDEFSPFELLPDGVLVGLQEASEKSGEIVVRTTHLVDIGLTRAYLHHFQLLFVIVWIEGGFDDFVVGHHVELACRWKNEKKGLQLVGTELPSDNTVEVYRMMLYGNLSTFLGSVFTTYTNKKVLIYQQMTDKPCRTHIHYCHFDRFCHFGNYCSFGCFCNFCRF